MTTPTASFFSPFGGPCPVFNPGSIIGSTFFASKEPVRNPLSLKLVHSAKAIGSREASLIGSIGHRLVRGLLLTADTVLCNTGEADVVEVTDYDPVRRTSIVIGMKEPSMYVALHWLGLRTNPDKQATLFLAVPSPPPGTDVFGSKLLHGSFEEAMEVAKALKASKKDRIFIDGAGLFMLAKDLDSLKKDFEGLLKGPSSKKAKSKNGKAPKK